MAFLSLIARLGLNASGFEQGLRRSQSMSRRIGADISSSLKGHLAAAFGTAAIIQATRKTIEYGSQINDLSKRLGVSTDALQEFDFAAKQNGGTLEQMAGFLERIAVARSKALGGDAKALAAFGAFGVGAEDLRRSRSEDIARTIGRGLGGGDIQQLMPALRELGGRGAGSLVATLQQLDELRAEFERLGLAISPENIAALDAAGDSLARLAALMRSELAPAVAFLADGIKRIVGVIAVSSAALGQFFTRGFRRTPADNQYLVELMERYFGPPKERGPAPVVDAFEALGPARKTAAQRELALKQFFSPITSQGGLYFGADAALRDLQRESVVLLREINENTRRLADANQAEPEFEFDF
jgi:hypothetical protein